VAEIASVVSEPAAVLPEELQIKNDGAALVEEDLVDPLPPTDNLVQEEPNATLVKEAVESFSSPEPSVAEIVSVVSEPPTEEPKEFSFISDSSLAGDDLIDPPLSLQNVETEHIGERTEGQGKAAILETAAVDDLVVDQAALDKVEMQSFDETEAPETHVLNGNGHSTTTQANSVNLATDEDKFLLNIQADPKNTEPIHPSHISPASATLEAPSTTD